MYVSFYGVRMVMLITGRTVEITSWQIVSNVISRLLFAYRIIGYWTQIYPKSRKHEILWSFQKLKGASDATTLTHELAIVALEAGQSVAIIDLGYVVG